MTELLEGIGPTDKYSSERWQDRSFTDAVRYMIAASVPAPADPYTPAEYPESSRSPSAKIFFLDGNLEFGSDYEVHHIEVNEEFKLIYAYQRTAQTADLYVQHFDENGHLQARVWFFQRGDTAITKIYKESGERGILDEQGQWFECSLDGEEQQAVIEVRAPGYCVRDAARSRSSYR